MLVSKMSKWRQYLSSFQCTDRAQVTHTRIPGPGGIHGGKYNIPDSEMSSFYRKYVKYIMSRGDTVREYLTERQLPEAGPILVDLDIRYDTSIQERQHDSDHLTDLMTMYEEELSNILEIPPGSRYPMYAFEKPHVNCQDNCTKDGIHIVIGIELPHHVQQYLRKRVLEHIDNKIGDLPLENDYESVIDPCIPKGKTNWQLFGSQKPGNEAYEIVARHDVVKGGTEEEDDWVEEHDISEPNYEELLPLVSARNRNCVKFPIKPAALEAAQAFLRPARTVRVRRPPRGVSIQRASRHMFEEIKDQEGLDKLVEDILDEFVQEGKYPLREIHEFTMLLGQKYYSPYEQWLQVGCALYNSHWKLFPTWMMFSAKSPSFNFEQIGEFFSLWSNGLTENSSGESLRHGSIMYWAKQENPEEYKRVKERTTSHYLDLCLNGETEYDLATALYQMEKDRYRCVNIPKKFWYEYRDGRWHEIQVGTSLRRKISDKVSQYYSGQSRKILDRLTGGGISEEENTKLQKRASKMSQLSLRLRRNQFKSGIMREAAEVFFDKNFLDKLDANPMLLCFKNGVVDFEKKEFRPGRPEDFCSLCTRSEYVELDDHDPEQLKIRAEVETFLAQLFPDPELREYMIESLAAVLRGDNKNQTFNILTGSGRNGKSKLIDLMGLVLGDYKGTVPLTLITNKRGSIGSVSPEVAGLKGLRYAVMQEPSKGMQINEGVMKELTGGDPISGRKLFHDTITFKPQFSLAVCTNHLFDIKSTDDGTWRRIRVCPFVSKFVPKPYKDPLIDCEHQFLCDKDIDKNFTRWAPILTAMLVKKAFETDGEVTDCECVIASSQQYKQKQDHFMTFFNERIVEDSNGVVKRLNALHEFQDWYGELYGSRCPQGRELYDYLTKRMGAIDRNKRPMGWYGYRLERSYQDQLDVEPDDI